MELQCTHIVIRTIPAYRESISDSAYTPWVNIVMNEVRDFGVNQFTGKYLTDTGYKDVVQEQG